MAKRDRRSGMSPKSSPHSKKKALTTPATSEQSEADDRKPLSARQSGRSVGKATGAQRPNSIAAEDQQDRTDRGGRGGAPPSRNELFRRSRAHQSNPLRRVDLCSASEREDEYVRRCQALPAGRTGRARHNTSGRPHGKQPRPRRPRFRSIRETCR